VELFQFLLFDVDAASGRIVIGFVGRWIPGSGIQAIVGSEVKSQDSCTVFHDGVISTKPFSV
jgi:hypothetical protein